MVRLKNRYLLCEVQFEDEQDMDIDQEHQQQQLLQAASLRQAIGEQIQSCFGDFGSAQTSLNLQVKYVNSVTRVFIVRSSRDHLNILWNSLTFMRNLGDLRVRIRVLHSSGTIKKQEIVAKRYLSRWMHKMLRNPTVIGQMRTTLLENHSKAKKELEALEQ